MWAPLQASIPAYRSHPDGLAHPSSRGLACPLGDGSSHAPLSPEVSCQKHMQSPNVLSARTRLCGGTVPRTGWHPPVRAQDRALSCPGKEQAEGGWERLP